MKKIALTLLSIFLMPFLYGQNLTGNWYGLLKFPTSSLHIVFHVNKNGNSYTTGLESPDQGSGILTADKTTISGNIISIESSQLEMKFSGKYLADSNKITGTFTQRSNELPLVLDRNKSGAAEVTAASNYRSRFMTDSLDAYIKQVLSAWQIPGAAVCVIKDGRVLVMKGYGVKELNKADKVDENTLFMIGSNTKAFTATAMAMLQEQHKLSLDDHVIKYLPQFRLNDTAVSKMVTVRDLLCHRLGFGTFQGDFTFYNTNLSREEVIQKMALVERLYPFRTKWGYTNAAFLTAGQIIPKVTGQPWEVYLKQNIFDPLGMSRTLALSKDIVLASNKAAAHTMIDGKLAKIPYALLDNLAPAGAISSSAADMSKWVLALLDNGQSGSKPMIPAGAIRETRRAQDIVGTAYHANGFNNFQLYGLGWFLQDYENHMLVMHDGGVNGFVSSVTLVPQMNLGIVILTNTDSNDFFEALRWEIMDAFFGLPYQNYSSKYVENFNSSQQNDLKHDQLMRDSVKLNLKSDLPLEGYTGLYRNVLYGTATISKVTTNSLSMRFEHHPGVTAVLSPLGGNRFYVVFSDPTLGKSVFPFSVMNGKVTNLTLKVADFVENTPYNFKKE